MPFHSPFSRGLAQEFFGTWEIIKVKIRPAQKSKSKSKWQKSQMDNSEETEEVTSSQLDGTIFTLDQNQEVTWHKIPENTSQEENNVPLFDATSYHIKVPMLGKEHVQIEFCFPFDESLKLSILLVDENLVMSYSTYNIYCRKIELGKHSLQSVFTEGLFSDLVFTSSDGKQFKLNKCVVVTYFPLLDFEATPLPLEQLSSDVIMVLVDYMYNGVISIDTKVELVYALKSFCDQRQDLSMLSDILKKFIRAKATKTQIVGLISDSQSRLLRIATLINGNTNFEEEISRSHLAHPEKFADVLKECLREIIIGSLVQLQMVYLYGSKKIPKSSRTELIQDMMKKLEEVRGTLEIVLKVVYKHMDILSDDELALICQHCQPQLLKLIEFLDKLSSTRLDPFMKDVINQVNEKFKREKLKKSSSKIAFAFKSAIRLKELSQLRDLQENISHAFVYISQKSESIVEKMDEEKVEFVRQIIDEDLPSYIQFVKEMKHGVTAKRSKRKHSIFKMYASYIKWFIDTVTKSKIEMGFLVKSFTDFIDNPEFERLFNELLELNESNTEEKQEEKDDNEQYLLSMRIRDLYISRNHADVEFLVTGPIDEDTGTLPAPVIIKAHRIIVSTRCLWFERALSSGMKESIDRKFEITDTSPNLFEMFIKYLYTFEIDFTDTNIDDLMELVTIADKYEHEELKEKCEKEICYNHINSDSVVFLLAFADKVNANFLKKYALKYMSKNLDCLDSEYFHQLPDHLRKEFQESSSTSKNMEKNETTLSGSCSNTLLQSDANDSDSSSSSDTSNEIFDLPSSAEQSPRVAEESRSNRLEECIETLRNVIAVPDEELMRLALAADSDSTRALNFYFGAG